MSDKMTKSEAEWLAQLSPEQYRVTRLHATEPPFTGKYCDCKTLGTYVCVCCGELLFSSETKFDSRSGWPSFWQSVSEDNIGIQTAADGQNESDFVIRTHLSFRWKLQSPFLARRGSSEQVAGTFAFPPIADLHGAMSAYMRRLLSRWILISVA